MRISRKLFTLTFPEDSDLFGVEITCKAATLGERREYYENYPKTGGEPFERVEYEARHFIDYVVEWNLEDEDGEPLPVAYEAYEAAIPFDWAPALVKAYTKRSLGQKVEDATEKKSEPGEPTETTRRTEASIPMEVSL